MRELGKLKFSNINLDEIKVMKHLKGKLTLCKILNFVVLNELFSNLFD